MDLADTATKARRVQLAIYRSLSPAQRVAIADALSEEARVVTLAGITRRQPHLPPAEAQAELVRIVLGRHAEQVEPRS